MGSNTPKQDGHPPDIEIPTAPFLYTGNLDMGIWDCGHPDSKDPRFYLFIYFLKDVIDLKRILFAF